MEKKTLNYRRELRNNPTDAESHLWKYLRRRQVLDHKFRRQHAIGPYITDFVCLEKKLVVEIDGSQHLDQERYDERRSRFLRERGYRVLRIWNNQVFLQTEAVLRAIEYALEEVAPESQGPPGLGLKETPIPNPSPSLRRKGLKAMRWLQIEACGVQPAEEEKKNKRGLDCRKLGVFFLAAGPF